jgi:cation:H+ antiporter
MLAHFGIVVVSLALLYFGAEWLVRGAASIAAHFGVKPLIVGLVIVGFGTSMPEVIVSAVASFNHHGDTALGNVIGSNIANSGLILAVATLIRPMKTDLGLLRREAPFLIALSFAIWVLAWTGSYGRVFGLAALCGLVIFVFLTLRWAGKEHRKLDKEFAAFEDAETIAPTAPLLRQFVLVVLGLMLLIGGGHFLVDAAVDIARHFGVSEIVIAITLVSIGTSVPELATSIVAATRGQGDISIGNVIGSNIFNLLGVLGVSATIRPLVVSASVRSFDMLWMVGFAVLTVILLRTGRRLSRWEGGILLVTYSAFIASILRR